MTSSELAFFINGRFSDFSFLLKFLSLCEMHSVSYIRIFPCTFKFRCCLTLSLVEGNHPGGDGSSGSVGLADVSLAKAVMFLVVLGWFGVGRDVCGLGLVAKVARLGWRFIGFRVGNLGLVSFV